MDLLKGYGSSSSDDDDSSASSSAIAKVKVAETSSSTTITTKPKLIPKQQQKVIKKKKGGKRLLSLGAVLPPEIFAKLTRPPEEDDSSTSSFEGTQSSQSKKRKRDATNDNIIDAKKKSSSSNPNNDTGDRKELNSLLSELRSTPMHVAAAKVTKKTTKPTKSNSNTKNNSDGKLGMAFMSYTSTTTTTKKKKSIGDDDVVDIHAVKNPSAKAPQQQQVESSSKESVIERISIKPTLSAAASAPVVQQQAPTSFKRSIPQQYAQMPEYPVNDAQPQMNYESQEVTSSYNNNNYNNSSNSNNNINAPKSRKQKREEERALRSGQAFASTNAIEMHQPSPSEHAPTAEAAVIAAKAARYRGAAQGGGGGGSISNIAMYDPKEGADVKGLGVTGKHRSKHQINQLMASAISLEAHRASEAELARFGVGSGSGNNASRADAKKKYGW